MMKSETFHAGKYIREIRIEKNISLDRLCRGLCSRQTLSKFEMGERFLSPFLVDRLLQRLGKSADNYEVILFDEEYEEILRLEKIAEDIEIGKKRAASAELDSYRNDISEKDSIRQQYYYTFMSVLSEEGSDYAVALEYINKAIQSTLPGFNMDSIGEYLLCTREIECLLRYADLLDKAGRQDEARGIVSYLLTYIDEKYDDIEEVVNVLPKTAYLLDRVNSNEEGNSLRVLEVCRRAFELLTETDCTLYLGEIMKILIKVYSGFHMAKIVCRLEKQLQALEEVYAEVGQSCYVSDLHMCWFVEHRTRTHHLFSEMLYGGRQSKGLSREQLMEGLYDTEESLRRMERGKQSPTKKHFEELMERLELPRQKYSQYIVLENSEDVKLREYIGKAIEKRDYEDAKVAITKIKDRLDVNEKVNAQYLMRMEARIKYHMHEIKEEEYCQKTWDALSITYPIEFSKKIHRIPLRMEMEVMNQLAISFFELNRTFEATGMLEGLYISLSESKINLSHRYISSGLIMKNYGMMMEILGDIVEAKEVLLEELRLECLVHTGRGLDFVMSELYCVAEKDKKLNDEEKKRYMEKYLRNAYYLSDLFDNEQNKLIYDQCYRETIDEEVQWYC